MGVRAVGRRSGTMMYGTMLLTFSGLFGQIVGFFYRIVLARLIGPEMMGLYQLIMPVYSVLSSITTVGLTVAASALSARCQAKGDRMGICQVRRSCLVCLVCLLAPLAVLTTAFSDPISVYILGDARTRTGLVLLLPCILLTGIENIQKHCFFGVGMVRPPAFSEMAEQVIRAVAVLGLLILCLPMGGEGTVGVIVMGMVVCEVFSAATLTLLFRRYIGSCAPCCPRPAGLWREIGRIAFPVGSTALLGNLMGSANAILIPQLLVKGGKTAGEAMSDFGVINGMTIPMLLMPTAFIGALGLVLVPKLAQAVAVNKRKEAREQLSRVMAATSCVLLPCMALLVVIGPALGQLLFKDARAGEMILPLAVGVIFTGYQAVLGSALNGLGKQSAAAGNMLLSDGVQLAFTYFLVGDPNIGLKGYVTGLWVSSLLGAWLNWRSVRKAIDLKGQTFSWAVAPGLGAVLMALCCRLLFGHLLDAGLHAAASCLITAVFGAVLYLVALQAQGIRRSDLLGSKEG